MANLAVVLIVMSNVGATQTLEEAFATGMLIADGQERRHRLRVFTRQALSSHLGPAII